MANIFEIWLINGLDIIGGREGHKKDTYLVNSHGSIDSKNIKMSPWEALAPEGYFWPQKSPKYEGNFFWPLFLIVFSQVIYA